MNTIDENEVSPYTWSRWPDRQPTAFRDTYLQLIWLWNVILDIWNLKAVQRGRNAIDNTLKIMKLKKEWKQSAGEISRRL